MGVGRRVLTVTGAVLALLVAGGAARADWVPGERMTEAGGRVMGTVRGLSDVSKFGYDGNITVMAAFIQPGKTTSMERQLTRGEEYMILGGGDDQTEDLDIEVVDVATDRVIAKDDETDASPTVRFTAPKSGKYKLRLTLFKAKRGCFACMVVLRKGGFDVPKENLVKATARLIGLCNLVDSKIKGDVTFHDPANQWALYGGIFEKGESLSITNLNMGNGRRVIVAAGDDNTKDIDLFLMDRNGKVLVKDEDDDPTPVLQWRTNNREAYGLKIKNAAGGRSLILAAVLDLED
jgi:hypothetical protein